jgi:hypothetical protein
MYDNWEGAVPAESDGKAGGWMSTGRRTSGARQIAVCLLGAAFGVGTCALARSTPLANAPSYISHVYLRPSAAV